MTLSAQRETDVSSKTFPVRLRGRGQITVPQSVRDDLDVTEGDILTLLQVGDVVLLTPTQPQMPRLADRIADMMESEGVSLADLLAGLKEEREAIWRERQKDA